jgi:uncharacterized protein YbjT (DUF2867 family)
MKVLITGGTGYIGRRLCEHIADRGHDVRLLVRRGSEGKVPSPDRYDTVHGDAFNTNARLRATEDCDAVVHLIGIIREFPDRGITFDQLHRVATHNVADAARRNHVGRFIHMSALGVQENAHSLYYKTKYAAEEIVKANPFRWTIFRPSFVMGYGDHATQEIAELVRKPVVPMIDGGKNLVQPVALDDLCTVMAQSLGMPETQGNTYEIAGPDRISFADLMRHIADAFGVHMRSINVPSWVVGPMTRLFERYPWFPLTVDQLRMLREDNVCEIDRYVKTFRIEPRTFRQILPTLTASASVGDRAVV